MRSILEALEVNQVHLAHTYDDATGMLNGRQFDCIFIDNMMSTPNGLELTKYIRHLKNTKTRAVPIILYTAFTGLQSIIHARDVGVTEILSKPVSPEQIMEKMNNALFNPRSFINTGAYSGPDRRRRIRDFGDTDDRRKTETPLPAEDGIPLPAENELTIDDKKGDA